MTLEALILALALPTSCRVDKRVPKKMLIENGAPTTADMRMLNDAIAEIQWIAALKPNTVGVPDYRADEREYLELTVLSIATRGSIPNCRAVADDVASGRRSAQGSQAVYVG